MMQRMIRSIFVLFSLGFFTVVSAQLPPKIMADKHLIHAEQLYAAKDYAEAFKVMKKIIALQQEHSLTLSDEFHFKYAQVALSADSTRIALESVTRYLSATGDEGQFYKEALALMLKAEGNEVMTAEDFYNEVIKAEGTCGGLPKGSKCWMELTNHPECYVWNDDLSEGETAIWTGQCSGHLPDGKGTLTWENVYNEKKKKLQVLTGTFQKGKRQGHWTEQYYYSDAEIVYKTEEGSYVDDKKHGQWIYRGKDGDVSESSYVDGKLHGHYVSRHPDGSIELEGSYVDGKEHGQWIYRGKKGDVDRESFYVDGKLHGHQVARYRDGTTEETSYVDGKAHERVIRFSDGIVGGSSYDADGKKHGEWIEGDEAQDKEKGKYVNGKKEGIWLSYDEGNCSSRIHKVGGPIWGYGFKKIKKERCREAGLIPDKR